MDDDTLTQIEVVAFLLRLAHLEDRELDGERDRPRYWWLRGRANALRSVAELIERGGLHPGLLDEGSPSRLHESRAVAARPPTPP